MSKYRKVLEETGNVTSTTRGFRTIDHNEGTYEQMKKESLILVGAFPLGEKCPTIAVTVFFLQTTILKLIGPLFLQFLQS